MRLRAPVIVVLLALFAPSVLAEERTLRLDFVGDVLLSRQVAHEIDTRGVPANWQGLFGGADFVLGNLEGGLGAEAECTKAPDTCFAIRPERLSLLRQAGFTALGLANNHSRDTGAQAPIRTRNALLALGLQGVAFDDSPRFIAVGPYVVAMIAVNEIGETAPRLALAQKLDLARTLADLVIVSLHWGQELVTWHNEAQERQARWLIANGADLIIGHHPHVVQQAECVDGRPVFYSLGNFLFDQKYPETQHGTLAACQIENGSLSCATQTTHRAPQSFFPVLEADASKPLACKVPLHKRTEKAFLRATPSAAEANGTSVQVWEGKQLLWQTPPTDLLHAELVTLNKPEGRAVFFVKCVFSPIDHEIAPRPYVYTLTGKALWRGSALAWPLRDARFLPGDPSCLCTFHRGDSFLKLDPQTKGSRSAIYRWNGFGFSIFHDETREADCKRLFHEMTDGE